MSAAAKPQPPQLVLDLAHRQARGVEDFLVSGSNAAAVESVDRWPDWASPAAIIVGPEGSGKTHLAHVWAERAGATIASAAEIDDDKVEAIALSGAVVVEDVDRRTFNERVLFHLLNLTREKKLAVLLTSRRPPGELAIALPDLRSRLRALAMTVIDQPDEALLRAVLVKLFGDRQLEVEPPVVAYLALHMERSMLGASRVVAEADRLALARQRRVSRAVAAEALENLRMAADEAD